jgi:putative membrane protein
MQMMDYGFGNMMSGWGILALIFWLLGIVGLILFIKHFWECRTTGRNEETALEILKKRYANGEITKVEFEEKKKDIL